MREARPPGIEDLIMARTSRKRPFQMKCSTPTGSFSVTFSNSRGFTHMERRAKKMGWKCTKVVTLHVPRRRRKARK